MDICLTGAGVLLLALLAVVIYSRGHQDGYYQYEAEVEKDLEQFSDEVKEKIRRQLFGDETETTTNTERTNGPQ